MKTPYSIAFLILAFLLDLILADPYSWPHPVKVMGKYISFFENKTRVFAREENEKKALGLILVISLVFFTILIAFSLLKLTYRMSFLLFALTYIYLSYSCISVKGMANEARKVVEASEKEGLEGARRQVSMIVGRQTDELTMEEVYAATIETTAENTSDGAIAPIFYLAIFGPIGGLVYKAINTMDSMVAYLTPKYKSFGRCAAILDDIANYLPARLSAIFMVLTGKILGLDTNRAINIIKRDSRKHLSPNSGYPEAAIAGLLGVQLGGSHVYAGVLIEKPAIGDALKKISKDEVKLTVDILYISSTLFLVSSLFLRLVIIYIIKYMR